LYFENVLHLAVEALRPEWEISARIHELGVYAKSSAGTSQSAGEDTGGTELLTNLRRGHRLVPEAQYGGARKDVQSPNLRQLGDDILSDAVAQVFVFLGAA